MIAQISRCPCPDVAEFARRDMALLQNEMLELSVQLKYLLVVRPGKCVFMCHDIAFAGSAPSSR
jgi:hypothetical protein